MSGRDVERSAPYGASSPASGIGPVGPGVDELARALTERERRALLERIAKSLSVQDDDRRRIIHGELRRERRTDLIATDMGRLTFWEKARLWFRRWMSGQSDEEVFVRFRLRQARDRVRAAQEVFVDFDNRAILEGLPEATRTLCRRAVAVRNFFTFIWHDTETLRGVLDHLLAKRVPDAKRSLNQFCATHELQEVFRKTESRSQLKQLVLERVSDYINRIPPSVIEELEAGLKPLYMLKDLVLFDFDGFYVQFQATEEDARSSDESIFHSAAAHRVLDHLERLYLALYNTSQIAEEGVMYPEVLNYYFAARSGTLPDEDVLAVPDAPRAPELRAAIDRLVEEAHRLRQAIPLTDIIRFFRDDPYYRFLAYIPTLKLRDFYYSNLKIEVLQELDRRFKDVRLGAVGQIIQEVFPDGLLHLEYFHPEIQAGIKRAGIGQLQVYRSLQVIHTFIRSVYRKGLLDFIRVLGRLLPARTTRSGVDLSLHIAGLDDIAERLRDFDLSFSPESEEGKRFYRYATSERDVVELNTFRALVTQKERDAQGIIEKFHDQIHGVRQILDLVKKTPHQQASERYGAIESPSGVDNGFDERLDASVRAIESTEKILSQMINVEGET